MANIWRSFLSRIFGYNPKKSARSSRSARKDKPRVVRLTVEELGDRIMPSGLADLQFLWSTPGLTLTTYADHASNGIDINQPAGQPSSADSGALVLASFPGYVINVESDYSQSTYPNGSQVYGNYVLLAENADGTGAKTRAAHLKMVAADLLGATPQAPIFVDQGHTLGWLGNTGYSSAHHEHYELFFDNVVAQYELSPTAPSHLEPLYFKGYAEPTNNFVATQRPDGVFEQMFSFVPEYEPRSAAVMLARPGENVDFGLKGFYSGHPVHFQLRNSNGGLVPIAGTNSITIDTWDRAGPDGVIGAGVGDPNNQLEAGHDDGLQLPTVKTLQMPTAPGVYLLEAREKYPLSESGSNVDITLAESTFPPDGMLAAYAMPTIILITPDAPLHNFKTHIASMRAQGLVWNVHPNGTLVIAGDAKKDDAIILEQQGAHLGLRINGNDYSLEGVAFNRIFVHSGDGANLVDVRAAAPNTRVTVVGGNGTDIILGGNANDVLVGGDGNDWIEGGGGSDFIFGGGGNDIIFAHTSARKALFDQQTATTDTILGERGNDTIYSRPHDHVYGGDGNDVFYGQQGESGGAFRSWSANNVAAGIAGTILMIGDDSANQFTISALDADYRRTFDMDGHSFVLNEFLFTSYSRIVALPGAGNDVVNFGNSPVGALVDGGSGNDLIRGSGKADVLRGGSGADTILGEGGDDSIGGKTGDDLLFGGAGNDQIYGDLGQDTLHGDQGDDHLFGYSSTSDDNETDDLYGESGVNTFRVGVGDQLHDRDGDDMVIGPGVAAPARAVQVLNSYQVAYNGNAVDSAPDPMSNLSRLPLEILEFSISPSTVPLGDSAVFTIRATEGQWARLTIAQDGNGNGVFDSGADPIVGRFRPKAQDWRGQLTINGPLGTNRYFAWLDNYDGSVTGNAVATLQVTGQPQPVMPTAIDVGAADYLTLLPHRNGDVTVPDNVLAGAGQIEIFRLSPRTAGNYRIWVESFGNTDAGLFNAAGQRIAVDDDSGPGANPEIIANLAADTTVYFAVSSRENGTLPFTLHMTGANQTVTATISTPPGAYAGWVSDTITANQRLDYFETIAPPGATLLDVDVQFDPGLKLLVRVADEFGAVVGYAELDRPGHASVLTGLQVVAGRRYYITVFGSRETIGNYTVSADFYPDQLELPDTIAPQAWGGYVPLIPQADGDAYVSNLSIDAPGQFRYFKFSPTLTGTYTIAISSAADLQMAAYEGAGAPRIVWSDNDADDHNPLIRIDAQAGVDYWIVVRGAGDQTGSFSLSLFGPDQSMSPLTLAGLSFQTQVEFGIANNQRERYFQVNIPNGVTALNASLSVLSNHTVDPWLSIENTAGEVTIVNAGGANSAEVMVNYPVQSGDTYKITTFGWAETTGGLLLTLDGNPNFSGNGEIPVNTSTFENQRNPDVAMNSAGDSIFVWSGWVQNGAVGDYEIRGQRFNSQMQPVGAEFQANADDGEDQTYPVVGIDNSGNSVVAWVSGGKAWARRYNAAGAALGGPFDTGLPVVSNLLDVAMRPDGSFFIVAGNVAQLRGRAYDAGANPIGEIVNIDGPGNETYDPAVAAKDDGYLVSWTRLAGGAAAAYVAAFSAQGSLTMSPFRVAPGEAANQWDTAIDANAAGAFAVAYRSQDGSAGGDNVRAALFRSNGTPIAAPVLIHEFPAGVQERPDVAMKNNGEVVVVFDGDGRGSRDVFARHIDAAGNPDTQTEVRLNDYPTNDQTRIVAATNGLNRFAVVWQSFGQDGSGEGVIGRFIDFPDITPRPLLRLTESSGLANDDRLEYGLVQQGTVGVAQSVHVSNAGTATLSLSAVLAGAAAYTIDQPSTFELAPGQGRDILVSLATSSRGQHDAELVISHNAAAPPRRVALSGRVVPLPDSFEPNESSTTAANLGPLPLGPITGLSLHRPGDVDFYRVVPTFTGLLHVGLTFAHAEGNIDFKLLDQNLSVLAAGGSLNDNEAALAEVRAGEAYFVVVSGANDDTNVYALELRQPRLALSIEADAVAETAGAQATTGVVTRLDAGSLAEPLTVTLSSSDASEATAPLTVTITAGQTSTTFPLAAIDDTLLDGVQTVTLTAAAGGFTPGFDTLQVTDHESLVMTLSSSSVVESGGAGAATATVRRTNTDNVGALVVTLSSSDATELRVPSTITIPAGIAFVTFPVDAINDFIADGTQTVLIAGSATGYLTCTAAVDVLDDEQSFYVSTDSGGSIASSNGTSLSFTNADILSLTTSPSGQYSYSIYFDASDVGLTTSGENVDAFLMLPDGRLVVSTKGSYSVPRPGGGTISGGGEDLLLFTPTTFGATTAGTWALWFDGSDVGLSGSAENIDGVAQLPNGLLVISTAGSATVTGTSAADEDLLVFTSTTLGETTRGSWALYFDGSDVGMSASSENIDATFVVPTPNLPQLYLSTRGSFAVPALSGADEDVFMFSPTTLGNNTNGTFSSSLAFDGSKYGLSTFGLDGIRIGLAPIGLSGNAAAAQMNADSQRESSDIFASDYGLGVDMIAQMAPIGAAFSGVQQGTERTTNSNRQVLGSPSPAAHVAPVKRQTVVASDFASLSEEQETWSWPFEIPEGGDLVHDGLAQDTSNKAMKRLRDR